MKNERGKELFHPDGEAPKAGMEDDGGEGEGQDEGYPHAVDAHGGEEEVPGVEHEQVAEGEGDEDIDDDSVDHGSADVGDAA